MPLTDRDKKVIHQLAVYEREARKMSKSALESHYSCALVNWNIALDEMDRMRAETEQLKKLLTSRRRRRKVYGNQSGKSVRRGDKRRGYY